MFCSHAAAYQWYFNGSPIPGATDSFYVAMQLGNYAVMITDENGCSRLSNGILSGTTEIQKNQISIYPNPAKDELNIVSRTNSKLNIEIFDVAGASIYKESFVNQAVLKIPLMNFANGVYFLKVNDGELTNIEKVLIQR
jgi:hypothetical protein